MYIGRRRSVLDGARIRAYTVSPSADERKYYTVHSVYILQCIIHIYIDTYISRSLGARGPKTILESRDYNYIYYYCSIRQ